MNWFRTISSTARPFTRKWEEATNTQQQNEIKALTASLREQAAQIQKVSAQFEVPDPNAMIICHCGGGGRSALAAETLQKMGYKNVRSMAGGFKAWKTAGLPTTT